MNLKESQLKQVLEILKNGHSITSMEAFNLGITRLSSIIYRLRHDHGLPIAAKMIPIESDSAKSRYAKYYIEDYLKGDVIDYSTREEELTAYLKTKNIEFKKYGMFVRYSVIGAPDIYIISSIDNIKSSIAYLEEKMQHIWYDYENKQRQSSED